MDRSELVISRGSLKKGQLSGKVALITGAGGGIGFEAARSLIWLGARIIIAEIDKAKGKKAEASLTKEFGENCASFVHTDIGSERSVKRLARYILSKYGKLDVLMNNATIAPIGAVHKVGTKKWDLSYRVNLRGPVTLISHFLPHMLVNNSGIIVFVPSSGAAPFMGAYEVMKTSQVELCNTLVGELEGTGLITYSIGPGIVKTDTAQRAITEVAPRYGKTIEEFYNMNKAVLISPEEAGAGFAASIAYAERYNGLETSSIQALLDANIKLQEDDSGLAKIDLSEEEKNELLKLCSQINTTFFEQSDGWNKRNVFERQWILRDFKKYAGAAPEIFIEELKSLELAIQKNDLHKQEFDKLPYNKIRIYYLHQMDLLKGFEKNPDKLNENLTIMREWVKAIDEFKDLFTKASTLQ